MKSDLFHRQRIQPFDIELGNYFVSTHEVSIFRKWFLLGRAPGWVPRSLGWNSVENMVAWAQVA